MSINFISSKVSNDVRTMYTKSHNVDIMTGVNTNDVIEKLFKSSLERHQTGLEEAMRGSEFVFDCVNELHYKLHKVELYRSYIGAAHAVCSKKYKTPKEIPVVCHNGSTYDYHFIIKELAKEFKGQFECLGENTENYITLVFLLKRKVMMVNQLYTN